ncbi:MAG: 23S rRNA (guanosine(2251)-2'-O)-methyltransferase RlmB [Gammaproteobacteria bacterium]
MSEKELVFGLHAATHLLASSPEKVLAAFVQQGRKDQRFEQMLEALEVCGCHVTSLSKDQLDRLAAGGRHQGVVLEVRGGVVLAESDLMEIVAEKGSEVVLLVLDGVQDPRNLGACLRVADGAGVSAVVAPKNRAAGLTMAAKKVASGAAVPFVQVTNLARCLRGLKEAGVWLVGTSDASADSLYSANLTGPIAIVLGGEEKGMRRLTREACDALISIPMAGQVSSLNVSVAAGVVLYEVARQRL